MSYLLSLESDMQAYYPTSQGGEEDDEEEVEEPEETGHHQSTSPEDPAEKGESPIPS